MIVVDSSAIVAIVLDEPERVPFVRYIVEADTRYLSAASLLEVRMVLYGRGQDAMLVLDAFLQRARFQIEPVNAAQSDLAFDAFRRYGKGTGHKAGLNFGDCFAYALAKDKDAPLLFKGNDFIHTDVARV